MRGRRLPARDLEAILGVTSALAAPFDLMTMLAEVVRAAKQVLHADRGSVWLHDAKTNELVLEVATGIEPVRVPFGAGIVGACAGTRAIINVPDCYADPRFDAAVDRVSGYRTRCMLTLPLVDHHDVLVGVMQLLNKADGAFDEADEALASALAAQCAVALQRVRMTEALIEGERMRQSLEMAREVQMSTLPRAMPVFAGYEVCGSFQPAELTGGDTFDAFHVPGGLAIVLGDATGHGIAPALAVTQMHAMIRMALALRPDLDAAFVAVNNRLAETLPDDRFITAFIGLLDGVTHDLVFQSGGQGPVLKFDASSGRCERYLPTSFPLGAMPLASAPTAVRLKMRPGDILALVSDGIFEYRNRTGEAFGEYRVEQTIAAHRERPVQGIMTALTDALASFAGGAPQEDDMTFVMVKRAPMMRRSFARSFDSIARIVAYVDEACAQSRVDAAVRATVDFVIEELFTNMVKYSAMSAVDVRIDVAPIDRGVEVIMIDQGVAPFDVTRARNVDISAPIGDREPGGLGLHLVRRLVDALEYVYDNERQESRITFRVTQKSAAGHSGAIGDAVT
ncbi:MAG TPA: SpoIIE family protein phosphatase [Casimicrobiaceae bacterium]|nr:SpoIIE family protein phosphatase [Casimicrobiaceae bacterium]